MFSFADTITLNWYNEDGTTNSTACTYGDEISLPPNPTKTGYTFDGWVARPEYDFSTITFYSGYGYSKGGYYSENTYHENYNCMYTSTVSNRIYISCNDSNLTDLNVQEWKVINANATRVYGNAKCSGKSGNHNSNNWDNASSNWMATYNELENATGDKQYCWCHLTGYKPSDSNIIYIPSNSLSWIYTHATTIPCDSTCAMWCAAKFASYAGLQNALLGRIVN